MSVDCKSAVIFVNEMKAARAFYEGLLGQEVDLDLGVNVAYRGGFALWQRDHAEPIVYGDGAFTQPWAQASHPAFEMYFEADGVAGIWDRMAEAGVEAIHEIREQPWGQRVFRVYDPDRNVIEIAERMEAVVVRLLGEGGTMQEVSHRTAMPLEVVRQMAAAAPADQDA